MPWNIEKNIHFQTFSQVYFINLHCDDKLREKRLKYRGWSDNLILKHKVLLNG
ncbi:hypothetical protein GCM10008932_16930 [Alkalibacterium iburiense]|uniref:Uncharacterized protein n=1 Tax=Alkalibacterium iburiense TaxID=290589 RepID=A0ABN0XIU6_9LACT